MTQFQQGLMYKCIAAGPIMIRVSPDDKSKSISVIRPNTEVECLGVRDGIIYKVPVEKSYRQEAVWLKVPKGYVRTVSLNGSKQYFELSTLTKQLNTCNVDNTSIGDLVMVNTGAVNSFGVKPDDNFYAPNKHKVLNIEPSQNVLYIGDSMTNASWYNMRDCVLSEKASGK